MDENILGQIDQTMRSSLTKSFRTRITEIDLIVISSFTVSFWADDMVWKLIIADSFAHIGVERLMEGSFAEAGRRGFQFSFPLLSHFVPSGRP